MKLEKMEWMVVGLLAAVFAIGFIVGFAVCNAVKVKPLETAIEGAEQEKRELREKIKEIAQKREEETREDIKSMDPDAVIDKYLNDNVLGELTDGADRYTRDIVREVFAWLRDIIRKDKTHPP
jgi:uncharacterized membrane protein YciS (DUF1049 family)